VTTRVIGLGQRFAGDDAVGLAVLEALAERPPPGVELHRVADAAELVELVRGAERVLIVDAAVGAGPAGTLLTLDADALAQGAVSLLSTHGMSVRQALDLARALGGGTLPRARLVAIAIDLPERHAQGLSEAVARAVPRAADRVRELLRACS